MAVDEDAVVECPAVSERERVECWRLAELLRAGYKLAAAEQIAARLDIDLHRALDLIKGGCAPELAARILL